MSGIINSTSYNNFNEIKGKNSSRIYLREVQKKGVSSYSLSETKWPVLKKMEHFFKQIFSGNSTHYWAGKEKVVKQCEKNHLIFGNDKAVPACPVIAIPEETPVEEVISEIPETVNQPTDQLSAPDSSQVYPGFEKYYLNYSIQLANSQFFSALGIWNWYDKIIELKNGASVFLGALPLKPGTLRDQDGEIYKDFKAKGIGAILTVVEPFENHSEGYLHSAVTPKDWKEHGFDQLQLPAEDYGTLPMEDIEKGVAYMESMMKQGKSVYVHCKAGMGRSLLIVVCYLIKNHGMTVDQALDYTKARRVQSGFEATSKKRGSALAFQSKYGKKGV